jgi:hypothetical protein
MIMKDAITAKQRLDSIQRELSVQKLIMHKIIQESINKQPQGEKSHVTTNS